MYHWGGSLIVILTGIGVELKSLFTLFKLKKFTNIAMSISFIIGYPLLGLFFLTTLLMMYMLEFG